MLNVAAVRQLAQLAVQLEVQHTGGLLVFIPLALWAVKRRRVFQVCSGKSQQGMLTRSRARVSTRTGAG